MAQQESINILEFQQRFQTNDACRDHLFKIRWPEGLTCPICGSKDFYKITTRNVYECKCGHQISLTAGTIMHGSHTPLYKWFWAIYLAAYDKRGVSALRLQKELCVSYPTAWLMLQKIRHAMGGQDSRYLLAGIVETDETYIGGSKSGGKRGRGTEKTPIQAALSVNEEGCPEFLKMEILNDITGQSIRDFTEKHIQEGSIIRSDKYSSYKKAFEDRLYIHEAERFGIEENPEHLKWLHQVIGNVKAYIVGTYHGIGEKHLQAYLDEFCFRFNRRQFSGQLFNRLLNACMNSTTITYQEIILPVST
ncbi:MAG: IS1595 family transposase [Treponema sp.]|jgi:transposase-like protein|nr:IS1595 family transposase [Treponema sp.]